MTPAQINAILQIGLLAIDTYASYQQGQLTERELEDRWIDIRSRLEGSNNQWEEAGK